MAAIGRPYFFNLSTGSFVKSATDATAINAPVFTIGDTPILLLKFLRNSGTVIEVIDWALALLVTIASARGGSVLASATATGPDSNNIFSATIGLGGLTGTGGVMEFKFGPSGAYDSYSAGVSFQAACNAGSVTPSTVSDTAIGVAQAQASFQPQDSRSNETDGTARISQRIVTAIDGSHWRIYYDSDCQEVKEKLT